LLWHQTGDGLWAALARSGAWLNAINLVPLWILDGNDAARAISKLERTIVMVVSAALGYALGEWVFAVVALGMGIRLFTRDAPPEPNNSIAAYFVAVVTALAMILWFVPGRGIGLP
jgi:Zn-dependent protease